MQLTEARIIVLVENQYQELELWYPVLRFREEGADVRVVGPSVSEVYASKLGYPARADLTVADVDLDAYDALIIPGGFSPEYLRRNPDMVNLVREADAKGLLVAAICHAGWLLATAGIVKGRAATCVVTIKDDVINAGARYSDEPVVVDGNLITSRLPNDLPQFCAAIKDALAGREPAKGGALPAAADPPASSPAYTASAVLKNRAAGPASANYRAYAVLDA
ncbi:MULTISPECIES: type 1 glutamine amidotransferase domain-containing protein [unclassified Streptosporangium]|uniref:type 1 glutamine amidotransferase domain-containing protein n=1 Tax=unclassified Streptosporangium TaxID=2632669 RepID=UPI002E28D4E8|nr:MULTISPECIES: type 1 glutamine amidotransferase domain-containing protein [unclassified Streptosporangium]